MSHGHAAAAPAPATISAPVVAVPQWLAGILVTALISVLLAIGTTIARMRDNDTLLAEKVRVLEVSSLERSQVLQALGALGAKVDALASNVDRIDTTITTMTATPPRR